MHYVIYDIYIYVKELRTKNLTKIISKPTREEPYFDKLYEKARVLKVCYLLKADLKILFAHESIGFSLTFYLDEVEIIEL